MGICSGCGEWENDEIMQISIDGEDLCAECFAQESTWFDGDEAEDEYEAEVAA